MGDFVPLNDEDLDLILSNLPNDVVLVGGQSLAFWAKQFNIIFDDNNPEAQITKDADFLGHRKLLDVISKSWFGKVMVMHKRNLTSLIGHVQKIVPDGIKNVDVIHRVFGLETKHVLKNSIEAIRNKQKFKVLHPLDVFKARFENLAGLEDKQTEHGAKQALLSLKIIYRYIELITQKIQKNNLNVRETSLLKSIEFVAKIATDKKLQGTAKAWGMDILDSFPIDEFKKIESLSLFLEKRWPQIILQANQIEPRKHVGGFISTNAEHGEHRKGLTDTISSVAVMPYKISVVKESKKSKYHI